MKRLKALIVLAVLILSSAVNANADFKFGVKAGLNINSLHFNQKSFDADNRCGFTAGVMTDFTVPVIGIGFDLSVMYTRMNSYMNEAYDEKVNENFGKNFIEIPLNLKYKFNIPAISQILSPYIYTGPTMALRLGSGDHNSFKTKTVQMGWSVGLGLQLIKHLQVGAGYTFGINNIMKYVPQDYVEVGELKVKNNYWTITAAWLF